MYCIKAQIIAKRQQIFVRSATDVQRRQQQRKPRRVGGVAGGGGGEQWPAEDSLTKETAQYEEGKKKHTDSGFSQTSVLRNIHLKFKRTKKEEIKDKWGWICTSYPPLRNSSWI